MESYRIYDLWLVSLSIMSLGTTEVVRYTNSSFISVVSSVLWYHCAKSTVLCTCFYVNLSFYYTGINVQKYIW